MDKTYAPRLIEQDCYTRWMDGEYFRPDMQAEGSYCIMLPPPNVTGRLHMGHAFQDTLMDILTRWHRMRGEATLWQPGTDHAGIATQMVVERQLESEGISRHDIGRDKFLEKVWEWKEESGGFITEQMKRLGASCDWSRERFTLDDGLSEAVREVFVRLYEDGLIYRGKRLVNWDPVLRTAVSDLEVISEEEQGHLWHMRYPLTSGEGHLVVATTRPETMLGDTAVAVHPEDERYRHLIGQTITLPLVGREIPIIGDDYVDPEFGSGCVKITPGHDFNDYAIGQRHDLPLLNVLTETAAIREEAECVGAAAQDVDPRIPERYRNLDRYEARRQIVADLEADGLLAQIDDHKLMVPRGDRSGTVIEPLLTDQWFVDLTRETSATGKPGGKKAITEPAIDAVRKGDVRFVPSNWENTYFQWLENIQDWCISRQLWWGHRIPAWFDADGNVFVGRDEAEVRAKYKIDSDEALTQDEDVLDTWFSSALWPFSTLGWPEQTPELERFYPTNVLVTGFDIIFFWVARMVMMGRYFGGDVPFHEVYVHGLVRDAHGHKMSKSMGNVLDPIDIIDGVDLETLVEKRTTGMMQPKKAQQIEKQTREEFPDGIEEHGTDALRFTFAAQATTGRDISFDLERVKGYRNFCNKLWNASRFVLMQCEGEDTGLDDQPVTLSTADRWIISELQACEATVTRHLETYRFDLAAQALYDFTWSTYCDWYLELTKPAIRHGDAAAQRGTRRTLVRVLETLLRLLHPFIPFITETIWQRVAPLAGSKRSADDSIMTAPFPVADESKIDSDSRAAVEWLQTFILGVRRIRAEMDIAPGKPLPILITEANDSDRARIREFKPLLTAVARIESIEEVDGELPESAMALVGRMHVNIPLAGLIDVEAELKRLNKAIEGIETQISRARGKLSNANFVERAPEAVVNQERERLANFETELEELAAQRERIRQLAP
ncbi:MAG: valine--tRNA ligase [Halothiobacillaceae bacterium]